MAHNHEEHIRDIESHIDSLVEEAKAEITAFAEEAKAEIAALPEEQTPATDGAAEPQTPTADGPTPEMVAQWDSVLNQLMANNGWTREEANQNFMNLIHTMQADGQV